MRLTMLYYRSATGLVVFFPVTSNLSQNNVTFHSKPTYPMPNKKTDTPINRQIIQRQVDRES